MEAIIKGKLDPNLAAAKCGKLSHSRWLTCGMRFVLLYMWKYNLKKYAELLRIDST